MEDKTQGTGPIRMSFARYKELLAAEAKLKELQSVNDDLQRLGAVCGNLDESGEWIESPEHTPMMRHNRTDILLTDEDEFDVETEIEVAVYFIVQPAEPDVGIPNRYGEISHVAMATPLGELIFTPTDYHMEQLQEKLGTEIYESQFTDERY